MTRFAEILKTLASGEVEFILIGGVAAAAHGSARSTQDVDVVYRRNRGNLIKLVAALAPYRPYLRGVSPGLPFRLDLPTVEHGLNFTLTTALGWIDLFGEIPGGGRYEDLIDSSLKINVLGFDCFVLDLEALIRTKKAAGRPKDFESLAELELLRKRVRDNPGQTRASSF